MRRLLILMCLLTAAVPAWAQQEGVLQIDDPVHQFLHRQQVLGRLPGAYLSHQPLSAYEAQRYLDSLALHADELNRIDRRMLARFRGIEPGPGATAVQRLVPFAYRNGRNLISVRHEDYGFEIDPLAYLAYGKARQSAREGRDGCVTVWQNTRGLRIGGHIGKYMFFESRLEENQRRDVWPAFEPETTTAPRLGTTKFTDGEAYDYFVATGLIGFKSKFFEGRFGRDRNRWGLAKGSVFLSNYPTVYDQLQLRTTVWRFQYTNLFTARAVPHADAVRFVPRLYGAFHHLEVALPGRLRAALFESVLFASSDTTGLRDSGFDITYLNPVIFLRAAESDRGGADNSLLGVELSWIPVAGVQPYTQFLLDELRLSQIGKGWWANKWAWLFGLHLANVPLPNLSLRAEYTRLRPYLYAHHIPSTAYLHYGDLLGHPAGPNATDLAFFVDYRPVEKLQVAFNLAYTLRGRNDVDSTGVLNFGRDPSLSTNTRAVDLDVKLPEGVRQNVLLFEGHLGYEILPSLFLETALRIESIDDAETGLDRYVAPFLLLRWGLPFQSVRY